MNIFWILALSVTSVGIFLLVLFLLPLGTKFIQMVGRLVHKFWVANIMFSGVFVLLLVQELSATNQAAQMYKSKPTGTTGEFYGAAELAKAQRNLYLVVLGLVVLLGLLLISWQVNSWTLRNEGLREKLQRGKLD